MKGERMQKGAIPSAVIGNSDEFSTAAFTPQAQPSGCQKNEKDVTRISPCVDIKYPFTEEGRPACLSRACPKNNNCKICCKDWSKE